MQRLADRIKQHVPTSIRTKNTTTREQPPRTYKNSNSKMTSDSAIGQHLLTRRCSGHIAENGATGKW